MCTVKRGTCQEAILGGGGRVGKSLMLRVLAVGWRGVMHSA